MSKIYDDFGNELEIDLNDVCISEPTPIGESMPLTKEEIEFLKNLCN